MEAIRKEDKECAFIIAKTIIKHKDKYTKIVIQKAQQYIDTYLNKWKS